MLKSCSRCGRVHDFNKQCFVNKQIRGYSTADKFRKTYRWHKKSEEIRKRVDKALEITDMTAFKKSEPHKLSGGQKQRVAIAGAIAMRTKCIVLDEPTAMLDPKGRREVLAALKKLNKDFGIAVILVTHYMDEAVGADRVIVMNDGKVSLDGTPQEVFKNVEYLRSVGLDVPKPLELAKELEKRGVTIGENILTADDFVREFKKCIGE